MTILKITEIKKKNRNFKTEENTENKKTLGQLILGEEGNTLTI